MARKTKNQAEANTDFPFEIGDVVELKSGGGLRMTVLDIRATCNGRAVAEVLYSRGLDKEIGGDTIDIRCLQNATTHPVEYPF